MSATDQSVSGGLSVSLEVYVLREKFIYESKVQGGPLDIKYIRSGLSSVFCTNILFIQVRIV